MAQSPMNTYFVSEKISRIRWVPEELEESGRFLTSSWEMRDNHVKLWRMVQHQHADDYTDFVPKCHDKIHLRGDISGLELLGNSDAVACTSDGHISILHMKRAMEEDTLQKKARSIMLHKFETGESAPCTAISTFGKDIATVGEDGRLNIVNGETLNVRRTIEADGCAITTVAFVSPEEILTGNRMGIIKVFDGRDTCEPIETIMISSEIEHKLNYVSCLAYHPTQRHIVLAGSEEGSITVWDLRQAKLPASYLSAHESAITEIRFHPTEPTKVFTACENGQLWQWTENIIMAPNRIEAQMTRFSPATDDGLNPWLNGDRAKSHINVTSLISDIRKSINSHDAIGSRLICGTDSEAIYFINPIM